jgi:integrase
MPRVELTDRFVAGAKADDAPQTDYFDSKSPGLALRVSSQGRKAWSFVFTAPNNGKRARMTLGSYPALSLSRARTEAKHARGYVEEGVDPRAAMHRRGAAEITVAELVDAYVADPEKAKLRSIKEVKRRLEKNALPKIGPIILAQLTQRDILNVSDSILRRGARTQAWHTFKDLKAVLRWGVANLYLQHSPTDGMQAPGGFTPGERTLSDQEIRTLWHGLPTSLAKSETCQRIVKLCLITGQRLGELSGMVKGELDLERKLWSIPGARTKNGHPHTVPLSDLAVTQIREALADAGTDSKAVFPAEDGKPLAAPRVTRAISRAHETSKERPLGRFGIAAWSAHDLRRTCLDNLAQLGVLPVVIGHVANHRSITKGGVTFAHYVQHSYEAEKRAALNLWADRLAAIVGTGAAHVLPMARRKAKARAQ